MKLKTIRCIAMALILIVFIGGMYLENQNVLSSSLISLTMMLLNLIIVFGIYFISKMPRYKAQQNQAVSKVIVVPLLVILAIMMLLPLIIQFLIVV
ncbi:hypothetical protein [Lactobacillus terrae]|uniref:hypothetical protein n=1 Tax=Lactobacillus terrae TaxID=2269374 RepID=UPI000C1B71DE|nr:hypothetical protein [Lactobacillus terrae]